MKKRDGSENIRQRFYFQASENLFSSIQHKIYIKYQCALPNTDHLISDISRH